MKKKTDTPLDFRIFRVLFYMYMVLLNLIWFIICLVIFPFGFRWRYNMATFTGKVFEMHFKKAIARMNQQKQKEYKNHKTTTS